MCVLQLNFLKVLKNSNPLSRDGKKIYTSGYADKIRYGHRVDILINILTICYLI